MTFSRRPGGLFLFVCVLAASACSPAVGGRRGTGNDDTTSAGGDNGGGQAGSPGLIVLSTMCGDGKIDANEACDDHNTVLGDGCSPSCQIEAGCSCDAGKMHCSCGSCGDGVLGGAESCDDHNTTPGDGCSATCALEDGWVCHAPGKKCVPRCGDGKIISVEKCDDGNVAEGDGCSSNCLVEPGASCMGMPSKCTVALCGNGVQEGNEGCDCGDGTPAHPVPASCPGPNGLFTGDGSGCSKTCTKEPQCRGTQPTPKYSGATHACGVSCGNGNAEEGEGCDDGNNADGDGCSKDCKVEPGFTCSPLSKSDLQDCAQAINAGKQCLELPVLYRDFKN